MLARSRPALDLRSVISLFPSSLSHIQTNMQIFPEKHSSFRVSLASIYKVSSQPTPPFSLSSLSSLPSLPRTLTHNPSFHLSRSTVSTDSSPASPSASSARARRRRSHGVSTRASSLGFVIGRRRRRRRGEETRGMHNVCFFSASVRSSNESEQWRIWSTRPGSHTNKARLRTAEAAPATSCSCHKDGIMKLWMGL